MTATTATEQRQDSQRQTSQRQTSQRQDTQRQSKSLDARYGKIGISAVAAAVGHQRRPHSVSGYRIPYDRD